MLLKLVQTATLQKIEKINLKLSAYEDSQTIFMRNLKYKI